MFVIVEKKLPRILCFQIFVFVMGYERKMRAYQILPHGCVTLGRVKPVGFIFIWSILNIFNAVEDPGKKMK